MMNTLFRYRSIPNYLVIEEPINNKIEEAAKTDISVVVGKHHISKRVSPKRWKLIKCFHLIEPNLEQLYVALDLYVPHYVVPKILTERYITDLESFIKSGAANANVKCYNKSSPIVETSYLTVVNDINIHPILQELSSHLSFDTMTILIHKYKETQGTDQQGNIFFDRGLTSAQCQKRDRRWLGLSGPDRRAVEKEMDDNEKRWCDNAETLLFEAIKAFLPGKAKGKGNLLYSVPIENRLFLSNPTSDIAATRYAITDDTNVVDVHVDSQNPRQLPDIEESYMNSIVGCFGKTQGSTTTKIIGYGRDSVVKTSYRLKKFGPCIKAVILFYYSLPVNSREITCEIFNQLKNQADSNGWVCRPECHMNKFVFYSLFIDQTYIIPHKYHIDVYQKISILYATILSESPDFFMKVTRKHTETSSLWKKKDYREIAFILYEHAWRYKISCTWRSCTQSIASREEGVGGSWGATNLSLGEVGGRQTRFRGENWVSGDAAEEYEP